MKSNLSNSGFTMIETLIYVVLFSLIMSGALVSIYGIIGSSARNHTKATVEEEGSFITGKIDWALTGSKGLNVTDQGTKLSMTKNIQSREHNIVVLFSNGNVLIKRNQKNPEILNNSNVKVTCPLTGCFTRESSHGDIMNVESINTEFTISTKTSEGQTYTQNFSTNKYLRK